MQQITFSFQNCNVFYNDVAAAIDETLADL